MAKVTFERGDILRYPTAEPREEVAEGYAYGIVLSENFALIIVGSGGRGGYRRFVGEIPETALPVMSEADWKNVMFEVRFALESVQAALRA